MDEDEKRRRFKGASPFTDPDFQRKLNEGIHRLMSDAARGVANMGMNGPGGYVWGFSMNCGPGGVPKFEEFGNMRQGGGFDACQREPLVDVIEDEKGVNVIVELPGVDKKDIELKAGHKSISIRVDTTNRKFYKELDLPSRIDAESASAKYKNGILDIRLKAIISESDEKKEITID